MRTGTYNVVIGALRFTYRERVDARYVAKRAGVSVTTARKYLSEMVARGEVVEVRNRRPNRIAAGRVTYYRGIAGE